MKVVIRILAFCLALLGGVRNSYAQLDSTNMAKLNALLEEYYDALLPESLDVKESEFDSIISECKDEEVRSFVAHSILKHYMDPPLMGEEAVAIYIYEKWFMTGKAAIRDDWEQFEAELFYRFNRQSMLDAPAPVLSIKAEDGSLARVPAAGRPCVIYFYDTSCAKCRLVTPLLPAALQIARFDMDFFAIFAGDDETEWREFKRKFRAETPHVKVTHLWDKDMQSDYQQKYGVTSTPKLYFVDRSGTVQGRRLDADALTQLISIYNLYYAED